jgi:hypothetical protein
MGLTANDANNEFLNSISKLSDAQRKKFELLNKLKEDEDIKIIQKSLGDLFDLNDYLCSLWKDIGKLFEVLISNARVRVRDARNIPEYERKTIEALFSFAKVYKKNVRKITKLLNKSDKSILNAILFTEKYDYIYFMDKKKYAKRIKKIMGAVEEEGKLLSIIIHLYNKDQKYIEKISHYVTLEQFGGALRKGAYASLGLPLPFVGTIAIGIAELGRFAYKYSSNYKTLEEVYA